MPEGSFWFDVALLEVKQSEVYSFMANNNGNRNRKAVPGTGQKSGSSNKPGGRTTSSNRNPKFQHGHGMQNYNKNKGT